MKYGRWIIALLISVGTVLAGCGNTLNNIAVIQDPMLSNGKQNEIKEALDKILPPGVEYVIPMKSEQKQAIFTEDVNKDGKQEAFVLYRNIGENQQVHLLVLKGENGNWNKVSDVGATGNTFDFFSLEDLNGDGNKEVIVGILISNDDSEKQLSIYEWEEKGPVKKVNRSYEVIAISDYDADGKSDILILHGERNKLQTAEMFSYEKGELKSRSLVELDPAGFHENIVSGKLSDGKKALFIDSGVGAHSMLTEIVVYDKGKLIKVGNKEDGILFKAYPLYSKDINNDGVTEVGGMYIPKGFEEAAFAEIPFIHVYADYRVDGTRQIIEERYTNTKQHFYITIPAEWHGKVTIENLDKGLRLLSHADQKVLFEVKWTNKESYVDSNKKLGERKDTVFYNDREEELPISNDNFHLLEDKNLLSSKSQYSSCRK